MYQVLVVDDEFLIRKRIIHGFEWNEFGYQVSGEADNGLKALEMLASRSFDLAIIDIAMPGMNGIELVKEIRRLEYKVYIIFLTGHSNFEYAQQALREGVYYYILKPLDEEEFILALLKLTEKIEKEYREKRLMTDMVHKQKDADRILRSKFFSSFFHRFHQSGEGLEDYGIDLSHEFLVAVLTAEEYCLEEGSLRSRVVSVSEQSGELEIIYDIYDGSIILLFHVSDNPLPVDESRCDYFERIAETISIKTGSRVSCGIGTEQKGAEGMIRSYEQAVTALKSTVLWGKNQLFYSEIAKGENRSYKLSPVQLTELRHLIESLNAEESRKMVAKILLDMQEKQITYPHFLKTSNQMIELLNDIALEGDMEIQSFMDGYSGVDSAFPFMKNIEDIVCWFEKIIDGFIESKKLRKRKGQNFLLVDKTKSYILDHYSDPDLSLTKIAESLYVSQAYISSSFKKAAGIATTEYITMIRLEKAKELIADSPGADIKEIAGMVGYSDEFYFSRCFKKYYGISPVAMKKQIQGGLL